MSDSELDDDPRWYQRAVIYQAHVRAFYDSNGDGIGDFRGLTQKLDYIHDLGVTAIWLLPFYPSPLRDGGYDVSDFTGIHPSYGSMRDFRAFVRAAHAHGLRVITELVLNHTSDQHPWFQRSRRAKPGSKHRDFYVWSDSPEKYRGTRIIFKDFEPSNWTYDPVARAYYWHRFYAHQPDLNWDNPAVEAELYKAVDFWLDAGVDGLRLDAVPYLYEREGTTCENLPETHEALKRLRKHVDEKYRGRMLLAEANQWPEDAVAYFGRGDECHMAFHFPLMPRLYMATEGEDRFPLIDIMQQTPPIPDGCQWAIFLRNHDELTLEMVTDEERDYMYRTYAANPKARINLGIRRRLAPLLRNDRRKMELLNGLLFSFNGTPIIYYGDEIGMGDNIYLGDRDGVRTPMQWNADRNAGFSSCDPQQLYLPVNIDPEYRYEAVNVEAQQRNSTSLYWWMKRLIALRRRYGVLSGGSLEFLYPENPKILAFLREDEDRAILVAANLSRSVQFAELDLKRFAGSMPREVFGRTRFPRIGELPYLLTLGPYAFYWLELRTEAADDGIGEARLPEIRSRASFAALTTGRSRTLLERVLPEVLRSRRWFGGKARAIEQVEIVDVLVAPSDDDEAPRVIIVQVEYEEGAPERYVLPIAYVEGEEAWQRSHAGHWAALAKVVRGPDDHALLVDALDLPAMRTVIARAMLDRKAWRGRRGSLVGVRTRLWRALEAVADHGVSSTVTRAEQSNTSVSYGDRVMVKLLRRLEPGINPDFEIGRHLTDQGRFQGFPAVIGALEYRTADEEPVTLALAQRFVVNHGDAWQVTLQRLESFLERSLSEPPIKTPPRPADPLARARAGVDDPTGGLGEYLQLAELLGERTAELHRALGAPASDPSLAPEAVTAHYQRGLYQSMRQLTSRTLQLLRKQLSSLDEALRPAAEELLDRRDDLFDRFRRLLDLEPEGLRIRCHGDFHLGQVLFTGRDWVIIDFEGEPARPIGERRIKRSALRDVAGMLRSFHYAMHRGLGGQVARGAVERDSEAYAALREAASYWHDTVTAAYLGRYLTGVEGSALLPPDLDDQSVVLGALMLEKAIYELGYELNNRPHMVAIPLEGIAALLSEPPRGTPP